MKIQLASDLHLEFLRNRWPDELLISPAPGADVLVLAGDISNGADAIKSFTNWPVPVIYVMGNHECYGHDITETTNLLRSEAASHGIHFLENDAVIIDGVRFLGTTIWTDYRLRSSRTQSQLMEYVETRLGDHFRIMNGDGRFSARDALDLHEIARAWLASELAKPHTGKTVVVTHHGCHPLSVHPRYIGDPLNTAFVSDLSELMPSVDLWLHGHIHSSMDFIAPGTDCRVVANPAGYITNSASASFGEFNFENTAFNKRLVVSL